MIFTTRNDYTQLEMIDFTSSNEQRVDLQQVTRKEWKVTPRVETIEKNLFSGTI